MNKSYLVGLFVLCVISSESSAKWPKVKDLIKGPQPSLQIEPVLDARREGDTIITTIGGTVKVVVAGQELGSFSQVITRSMSLQGEVAENEFFSDPIRCVFRTETSPSDATVTGQFCCEALGAHDCSPTVTYHL